MQPYEYGLGDVGDWDARVCASLCRSIGDIWDNWASMERNDFAQLDTADFSKSGQWNDLEMLEVGRGGMTGDQYRTHMSIWAMLRAPLIAGERFTTYDGRNKVDPDEGNDIRKLQPVGDNHEH